MYTIWLLILYQSYNDVSEYHLLTTHTYNYIYEIELSPSLSLPAMHKDYQVKTCFSSQITFYRHQVCALPVSLEIMAYISKFITFWQVY